MSYLAVRELHLACVVVSISLFVLRGGLMLVDSPLLATRPMRILPHVVDAVLLASAIWLVILVRQYPFVHGWLTAKVLALVAYVVLGSIALRRGRKRSTRIAALIAALLVVGYIVAVALLHDPWLGLA